MNPFLPWAVGLALMVIAVLLLALQWVAPGLGIGLLLLGVGLETLGVLLWMQARRKG